MQRKFSFNFMLNESPSIPFIIHSPFIGTIMVSGVNLNCHKILIFKKRNDISKIYWCFLLKKQQQQQHISKNSDWFMFFQKKNLFQWIHTFCLAVRTRKSNQDNLLRTIWYICHLSISLYITVKYAPNIFNSHTIPCLKQLKTNQETIVGL